MKLIELYKEWMEKGVMKDDGICSALPRKYRRTLEDIEPTDSDLITLRSHGMPTAFWGYGKKRTMYSGQDVYNGFTPLRQTIVLLICAIHDEL